MTLDQLRPYKILRGPLFAEPVQVIITPMATAVKLVNRGVHSGKVVDIILTEEKLELLETTPDVKSLEEAKRKQEAPFYDCSPQVGNLPKAPPPKCHRGLFRQEVGA
jgi:hypothetical protein